MDRHIKEFYSHTPSDTPKGNFHSVITLHEAPDINWNSLKSLIPNLCKGWFELAQLSTIDRIEFTKEFWMLKLPYHASLSEAVNKFFSSLDDIGIFLVQKQYDDPFEAHFIYSIKEDSGFFRGSPPATPQQIEQLKEAFPQFLFPVDYLCFLEIHNGFNKTTDVTGLIPSTALLNYFQTFQKGFELDPTITTRRGRPVNPTLLLPFYESFGMPYFQCFWGEWYPNNEMGNIYYSAETKLISDVDEDKNTPENMSFSTFTDWLIFYLERIA